jgi:16S rRNA (adenine1518-N6/adenine1519-N6)-dimethyltransferase
MGRGAQPGIKHRRGGNIVSGFSPAPPKRSLGQNFLIDPNMAHKLVDALRLSPGDAVLEIGPGAGALTEPLLEQTDNVVAIEIDDRLIGHLGGKFGDRLELIHNDVLKVDLTALAETRGGRLHVLGNLPYNASSPILFHLLAHRRVLGRAVLTLQLEVVDRCVAGPGGKDYGSVAVQLGLFAAPRKLFSLPPQVFRPQPKVTSAALRLDFTRPVEVLPQDAGRLETVVRAAFGKRRKTLRNSLSAGLGKETALALLEATGIDGGRRAETLRPGEFVSLADAYTALQAQ